MPKSVVNMLVSAIAIGLVVGCATGPGEPGARGGASTSPREKSAANALETAMMPGGPPGSVEVSVVSALGEPLPSRVDFIAPGGSLALRLPAEEGKAAGECPSGTYKAYVYVYSYGTPVCVDIQDVEVSPNDSATVSTTLLVGTSGNRLLTDFDQDRDLVLDEVELGAGADPADPVSIPGQEPLSFDDRVLSPEAGWRRGELFAYSNYGQGTESVGELVKRAEQLGLDFLAITDRNTMDACLDSEFHSDKVVLIPAMTWGDAERGVALLYGPRTLPMSAETYGALEGVARLVQAQGGVVAAAHPCFPKEPWQWGVTPLNAVQVWSRTWREIPPITLAALREELQERREGELVYSMARAAGTPELSANGQAELFWNNELLRGLKASPIGGSRTGSSKVPMASPVTYVYAPEKSVNGILAGLRQGRTFVSDGLDGPTLSFEADVLQNGRVDVYMGGTIPTGVKTDLSVHVLNAKGYKVEVIENGLPVVAPNVDTDDYRLTFTATPKRYTVYRVRVFSAPDKIGFGPIEMHALSAPIYAQDMIFLNEKVTPETAWISIETDKNFIPPVYATGVQTIDGKTIIRVDRNYPEMSAPRLQPLPPISESKTVVPKWELK
jgi:hypothetical protein